MESHKFKIGNKVKAPNMSSEGVVWKVTETSVHVRIKNTGQHGRHPSEYFWAKYLTTPWHHSQSNINELSHCD